MNINIYFVLTIWFFGFGSEINNPKNPDVNEKTAEFAVAVVENVSANTANGVYTTGDIIEILVEFDLPVDVTGSPVLELNTGDIANYVSGTGTELLIFEYEVSESDGVTLTDTENLNYEAPSSLTLNGGTITNAGDDANLSLPGIGSPNSLAGNSDIAIDTTEPELGTDPFSPDNNSLNVELETGISISFNENVSGMGTSNIQIVDAETSLPITLDAATAFTNTNALQLNFDTNLFNLSPSTRYYITINAGAIIDEAGNEFAGFTGSNTWAFSTYGPPVITDFPTAACVAEVISIEGDFLIGLSEIIINEGADEVIIPSADFNSLTNTEVSFEIPSDATTGLFTLVKDNGTRVSTNTDDPIKIGPSAAELVITGDQYLCFDSEEGTEPVSEISINISGGSGTYTIVYSENGTTNITRNNYNSGDAIEVTPPQNGDNEYELISVVDNDSDLSSCSPNLGTSKTITRFRRSVVDAGGNYDSDLGFGVVELCVTENNSIDLGSAAEMDGDFPSIEGSVTTGVWSIHEGPVNGGGFSQDFAQKTSTTIGATYYPNIADAFAGEVILKLTSDIPSNPNNTCPVSEDFIKIRFTSTITASPGQAPNICKDQNNEQVELVQLNGSSEGNIEWSLDDTYYDVGEYDNTWGFADTHDATTFTASSNNKNAYYLAKEEQLAAEDVIVKIIPTSTGSACSGTSAPVELMIPVNNLPQPSNLQGPANVCSGEELVRFSIDKDPNFTSNTFVWSISNSSNTEIDGGVNGTSVFVNFGEVSTATVETISVVEMNTSTGCESEPITFAITIQPLPFVEVSFTGSRAFSQSEGLLRLQGSDSAILNTTPTTGGVFSGPGVVLGSDFNYYINTTTLEETTLGDISDVHTLTFTFEDVLGCSNSVEFAIDIFDEDDIFPELSSLYCEGDAPVNISVNTAILESNQTVTSISGLGISYTSGNSAIFNPAIAREQMSESSNELGISYSVYDADNDIEIPNVATQKIEVIQTPNPVFVGISGFFCSDESDILLQRNLNLNPNNKFNFSLVDNSLPGNVISGNSSTGFSFHPNRLGNLLDLDDSLNIEIRYTYFNSQNCQNDTVFSTVVYRRPTIPEFEKSELCIVNGIIDTAKVTNAGEFISESIEWYDNEQLAGEIVGSGASFVPEANLVLEDISTFYAIRKNTQNTSSALCLSPISSVTYKRIDKPEFDWTTSSYNANNSIEFRGESNSIDLDSISWILEKEENDGFVVKEHVFLEASETSHYFDFNSYGSGLYRITLNTQNDFGCISSLSKELVIVEELVTNDNYRFNFNDVPQGWVATGNNSSWEWAIPQTHADASIVNENALWITNANGTYNPSERSYVYSPVFNLSQIEKPSVSFDLWLDVTSGTDGLILEYSTDDKKIEDPTKTWERLGDFSNNVSSGINWYNRSGIRSEPATGNNNLLRSGWTSIEDSVSARIPVKHILDGISNKEKVLFRFHFATTESSDLLDGVAFDNFLIESRNRTVLVEYFGNDVFTNDAQEMDYLNNRSENADDFVWINYRVNENDPFFNENASATLSRMFFYNAYSPESTFSLDGNYFENGLISDNAQNQNILNQRSLVTSPMVLDFDISTLSNDALEIHLNINSNIELNENHKLHLIVVNDELSDEDKGYYHVPRRFLTAPTGYAPGNETSLSYNFTVNSALDTLPLSVIAFIQNDSTGDVLQAVIHQLPQLSTDLVLSNKNTEVLKDLTLFPNPANNSFNIYTQTTLKSDINGRILDLTGKTVQEFMIKAQGKGIQLPSERLHNGLYTIQLWDNVGNSNILKLVVKH